MFGLKHLQHVKVPVSDLQRSARWYMRQFELDFSYEFTEQGVVRGVVLSHRSGDFHIGLRDRQVIPGQPELRGFDLFSIGVHDGDVLEDLRKRCSELGSPHGVLEERPDGTVLDITDPDGTVIRCYHYTGDNDRFTGIAFDDNGNYELYDEPRLDLG